MKTCLVIVFVFALTYTIFANGEETNDLIHKLQKRQIYKPVTIMVKPPFTPCVFYECIGNCRQRGYKNGGYCTINGPPTGVFFGYY